MSRSVSGNMPRAGLHTLVPYYQWLHNPAPCSKKAANPHSYTLVQRRVKRGISQTCPPNEDVLSSYLSGPSLGTFEMVPRVGRHDSHATGRVI